MKIKDFDTFNILNEDTHPKMYDAIENGKNVLCIVVGNYFNIQKSTAYKSLEIWDVDIYKWGNITGLRKLKNLKVEDISQDEVLIDKLNDDTKYDELSKTTILFVDEEYAKQAESKGLTNQGNRLKLLDLMLNAKYVNFLSADDDDE